MPPWAESSSRTGAMYRDTAKNSNIACVGEAKAKMIATKATNCQGW